MLSCVAFIVLPRFSLLMAIEAVLKCCSSVVGPTGVLHIGVMVGGDWSPDWISDLMGIVLSGIDNASGAGCLASCRLANTLETK